MTTTPHCFIPFNDLSPTYPLPERFNFPFHYEPHPLSRLAAEALQHYLQLQQDWVHNFGLQNTGEGLGKMFGVLVVRDKTGNLGYLSAFSGKLAGSNHHHKFVPPVFDTLKEDGFYRIGEEVLNSMNRRLEQLESNPEFLLAKAHLIEETAHATHALDTLKKEHQTAKANRAAQRNAAVHTLDPQAQQQLHDTLNRESAMHHFQWKDATRKWKQHLAEIQDQLTVFTAEINDLKEKRKQKSAQLQQQLFDQYTFLNSLGHAKNLRLIFQDILDGVPPAGAGECAAPKLLQYAFLHQLTPIALAEFWWGQTPASEIRKHGQFYPACRGKCGPILGHMLQGMDVDPNPFDENPAEGKALPVLYEDDFLLIVNKPTDFLSVPGKKIEDSVYTRIRAQYPHATGPLIVHRLDMSTSGLLLVAKTKEVHQHLQAQFAHRRIQKRYVALLEGIVPQDEGYIDLPLRVDLDDRPRQLVCYTHGKPAQTRWKVVERTENRTLIHLFPITGRTHQLRVHAAHPQGLNTPICGDELYGNAAERLYLHAAEITFEHPVNGQTMTIEAATNWAITL